MSSEIRTVIDQLVDIQAHWRDRQIELNGTTVTFAVPRDGTELDDFGDPKVARLGDPFVTALTTQIVIDFGDYNNLISEYNHSQEMTLPLRALVKHSTVICKGATTALTFTDKAGVKITRNFVVDSVSRKHENFAIAKNIVLVPIRN